MQVDANEVHSGHPGMRLENQQGGGSPLTFALTRGGIAIIWLAMWRLLVRLWPLLAPAAVFAATGSTIEIVGSLGNSSPESTIVDQSTNTVYWEELPPGAGVTLNSSGGPIATDPSTSAHLGDSPVGQPLDSQAGKVLNFGYVTVRDSGDPNVGYLFNPALFENGTTRLVYYGSTITGVPAVTGTRNADYLGVRGAVYDSDGSVVYVIAGQSNGQAVAALCRNFTALLQAGTSVVPGAGAAKFQSFDFPVASKGVILFSAQASNGRRGLYELNGTHLTRVLDRTTRLASGGTFNFGAQERIVYANEGDDLAVAVGGEAPAVLKRVAGKWSVVATAQTPVPNGSSTFDEFDAVAIHQGVVAFTGFTFAGLGKPAQAGIYLETGYGNVVAVLDNQDDLNGTTLTQLTMGEGGRWWNGSALGVAATVTGGYKVLRVTPAALSLTAREDFALLRSAKPLTIPVLANDYSSPGHVLSVTAITQPAHGHAVLRQNKVIYTPGAAFPGTDTFQYTVADGTGASATGTVTVRNPFLASHGTFQQGTFLDFITVTLTSGGSVSGKYSSLGKPGIPFMGIANADGYFQTILPGNFQTGVQLKFDLDGQGRPQVHGFAGFSQVPPTLADATTLPAGLKAGTYTVLFPPDNNSSDPRGSGWATLSLTATGQATLAGRLGDHAPLGEASQIRLDTSIAFSGNPYRHGLGAFTGTLTVTPAPASTVSGSFEWVKGAQKPVSTPYSSFDLSVTASGGFFAPPSTGVHTLTYSASPPQVTLTTVDGGIAAQQVTAPVAITSATTETATAGTSLTVKLDRRRGLLTGSFKVPGETKARTFTGVQVQGQGLNKAAGVFEGNAATGAVVITPQ